MNETLTLTSKMTTTQEISMPLPSRGDIGPVRITRIVAAPLFGDSPKGGWSAEIKAECNAA